MGAGVREAFPPPDCCVDCLRVSFGQIACGRLVSLGQIARVGRLVLLGKIAREWLFGLCGIAWKNMMEVGRGGACVPTRVAP